MKEIKYRAWDKQLKQMFEVESIHFPLGKSSGKDVVINNNGEYEWRSIDDIELMTFTSLYDTEGKEIYEGDVVAIDYENYCLYDNECQVTGQVVWSSDFAGYLLYNLNGLYEITSNEYYEVLEVRVIGNIHEHPSLLRKSKLEDFR